MTQPPCLSLGIQPNKEWTLFAKRLPPSASLFNYQFKDCETEHKICGIAALYLGDKQMEIFLSHHGQNLKEAYELFDKYADKWALIKKNAKESSEARSEWDRLPEIEKVFSFKLRQCSHPNECGHAFRTADGWINASYVSCKDSPFAFKQTHLSRVLKSWAYLNPPSELESPEHKFSPHPKQEKTK